MPDPLHISLLRRAIDQSGLSSSEFARKILVRDPRTVRRWLSGESPVPEVVHRWLLDSYLAEWGDD